MFASPVFKRLLTRGWDIKALMILLRAFHGQYSYIPRKLNLEIFAKVAVVVDYYECREALHFLTELWIEKLDKKIPPVASRDLILWL